MQGGGGGVEGGACYQSGMWVHVLSLVWCPCYQSGMGVHVLTLVWCTCSQLFGMEVYVLSLVWGTCSQSGMAYMFSVRYEGT